MAIKKLNDKTPIHDPFIHSSNPNFHRVSLSPLDKYLSQDLGDDTNGVNFQSVLKELESGQTDSSQLFAALLGAGDLSFPNEQWDMFYQYLLGLMQQANQRAFDIEQRDESRLYNNPMNELARLMGSGISRDAALEILKGSAGGSSSGSAIIGSGAFNAPSVSAPSGSMELQKQQNIADIVFGSLSALSNLMQSGVSLAQGIEQVKLLNSQNYFSQQQMNAFDSVQQITQALQTMQTNGEIEPADIEGLSNADDLIKFLQNASKNNEQIAKLIKSPSYAHALGTSYGRDYFNSYWKSLRNSRDEGTIYDEFVNGLKFDNAIKQLQPQLMGAEISRIGMENKVSEQMIIESANRIAQGEANIQYLNKQGEWIDAQVTLSAAQTRLTNQQTNKSITENKLLGQNYEYNEAGFAMLKQNRIDELTYKALEWNTKLRSPSSKGYVQQMQKAWLTEGSNAADAAYVMSLYYNAVGDFATSHPGLYQLGACFHMSGMDKLLKFGGAVASPEVIPLLK